MRTFKRLPRCTLWTDAGSNDVPHEFAVSIDWGLQQHFAIKLLRDRRRSTIHVSHLRRVGLLIEPQWVARVWSRNQSRIVIRICSALIQLEVIGPTACSGRMFWLRHHDSRRLEWHTQQMSTGRSSRQVQIVRHPTGACQWDHLTR